MSLSKESVNNNLLKRPLDDVHSKHDAISFVNPETGLLETKTFTIKKNPFTNTINLTNDTINLTNDTINLTDDTKNPPKKRKSARNINETKKNNNKDLENTEKHLDSTKKDTKKTTDKKSSTLKQRKTSTKNNSEKKNEKNIFENIEKNILEKISNNLENNNLKYPNNSQVLSVNLDIFLVDNKNISKEIEILSTDIANMFKVREKLNCYVVGYIKNISLDMIKIAFNAVLTNNASMFNIEICSFFNTNIADTRFNILLSKILTKYTGLPLANELEEDYTNTRNSIVNILKEMCIVAIPQVEVLLLNKWMSKFDFLKIKKLIVDYVTDLFILVENKDIIYFHRLIEVISGQIPKQLLFLYGYVRDNFNNDENINVYKKYIFALKKFLIMQ